MILHKIFIGEVYGSIGECRSNGKKIQEDCLPRLGSILADHDFTGNCQPFFGFGPAFTTPSGFTVHLEGFKLLAKPLTIGAPGAGRCCMTEMSENRWWLRGMRLHKR
jgi:hypothetical protein